MNKTFIPVLIVGAVLLIIATAGATTYFNRSESMPDTEIAAEKIASTQVKKTTSAKKMAPRPADIAWDETPRQQPVQSQTRTVATNCDDGNIVGKAVGGIGGGVLASNIGKGGGKTAATIAGTLGGAYVGGEFIPTRNVTCR